MSMLKVRAALEARMAAFAATKSLPVVWENIGTKPTGSYIKAFLFPRETQDPSFGNKHRRYTGMFRAMYYSTALNTPIPLIQPLVEDMVNYFPRGLQIASGGLTTKILNTPSILTPVYEGIYIVFPVEMFYLADDIQP